MIIADENIDRGLILSLKKNNYSVFSIAEKNAGENDRKVIEITKSLNGILITEDKDFGELVFAHNFRGISVIFLRYDKEDFELILKSILKILPDYLSSEKNHFITITKRKIRIKQL